MEKPSGETLTIVARLPERGRRMSSTRSAICKVNNLGKDSVSINGDRYYYMRVSPSTKLYLKYFRNEISKRHGHKPRYLLPVSRPFYLRIASHLKRAPTRCWDLNPERDRK
ncbi:hypothetical protein NDU88_010447 [Pleurodeles waltl]|uniref:Uncharacterized protein n=1 Tax=Pleurodeles waltl TaxID=8319 RepID=A0AAV7QYA9_PLEWA|nr:hypothetical protein NDU88_010447 [Pleurodeles waltl]